MTGPQTGKTLADVVAAASSAKEAPTFLPIGESEAIEKRFPNYEFDRDRGQCIRRLARETAEGVETIGFMHYIIANQALSEDVVADFAEHLYGARQTLATEISAPFKIEAPSTDKDATVPVHPGAAAYIDGNRRPSSTATMTFYTGA